jgi:hypothetical protein
MTQPHIDPRLISTLDQAAAGDLVQAVLTLALPGGELMSASQVDEISSQLVAAAQSAIGKTPVRVKIMPNLQTIVLEAHAEFIRHALQNDYIGTATLNAA